MFLLIVIDILRSLSQSPVNNKPFVETCLCADAINFFETSCDSHLLPALSLSPIMLRISYHVVDKLYQKEAKV